MKPWVGRQESCWPSSSSHLTSSFLVSFYPSLFSFSQSVPVKAYKAKWVGTRLSRQITVIGMLQHSCSLSSVFDLYPLFRVRGLLPHPPLMYLICSPPRMSEFLSRCSTSSLLPFASRLLGLSKPYIHTSKKLAIFVVYFSIFLLRWRNRYFKNIYAVTKNVLLLQGFECYKYFEKELNFQKVWHMQGSQQSCNGNSSTDHNHLFSATKKYVWGDQTAACEQHTIFF